MSFKKQLVRRWLQQENLCIWCGEWTWYSDFISTELVLKRLLTSKGAPFSRYVKRMRRATREHIIPKSMGGNNGYKNIVCACASCNSKRGNDVNHSAPNPYVLTLLDQSAMDKVRHFSKSE